MAKDISDAYSAEVWNRQGDLPPPGNARDRYGNTEHLYSAPTGSQVKAQAFVATSPYQNPIPWAIQMRFSTDGVTYRPRVPGSAQCDVKVTISTGFDALGGRATESFQLEAGELPSLCMIIASQLDIIAEAMPHVPDAGPTTNGDVFVKIVAAPLSSIACAEILGEEVVPGYGDVTSVRIPITAGPPPTSYLALPANANRAQFIVQNNTDADVMLAFDAGANVDPGSEHGVIVIPAGSKGGYESPIGGYKGPVSISIAVGVTTGFVLVSEGVYGA